jgi:hypothetical protein
LRPKNASQGHTVRQPYRFLLGGVANVNPTNRSKRPLLGVIAMVKNSLKLVEAKPVEPRQTPPKSQPRKLAKPAALAGGNPQIAKIDGDAPVQAYIAATPGAPTCPSTRSVLPRHPPGRRERSANDWTVRVARHVVAVGPLSWNRHISRAISPPVSPRSLHVRGEMPPSRACARRDGFAGQSRFFQFRNALCGGVSAFPAILE